MSLEKQSCFVGLNMIVDWDTETKLCKSPSPMMITKITLQTRIQLLIEKFGHQSKFY